MPYNCKYESRPRTLMTTLGNVSLRCCITWYIDDLADGAGLTVIIVSLTTATKLGLILSLSVQRGWHDWKEKKKLQQSQNSFNFWIFIHKKCYLHWMELASTSDLSGSKQSDPIHVQLDQQWNNHRVNKLLRNIPLPINIKCLVNDVNTTKIFHFYFSKRSLFFPSFFYSSSIYRIINF